MGEDEKWKERADVLLEEVDDVHCRGIWSAVLMQACIDARSRGSKPEVVKARREALEWLYGEDSNEFEFVCELAGVDPAKFRRNLNRFMDPSNGPDFRVGRKSRPHARRLRTNQRTNQGERHDNKQQTR